MKFSAAQTSVLETIAKWLADPNAPQVFRLAGPAGSGKSTLASAAVENAKGRVLFGAPTGKSALVMRRKGCKDARTLHSIAYLPAGDPPSKTVIDGMREECKRLYALNEPIAKASADRLAEQLKRAEADLKNGNGPRFSLKLDSEIRDAAVLVVDEASMISDSMGSDLVTFGTKILAIYDPYQLPPVRGLGYFTQGQPDALLDEIHRQALDSPILRLADLARRGERLPIGRIDDDVDVRVWTKKPDPSLEARALEAEMIIVGRNATRRGCNARIRQLLGREGSVPVVGDRVICKRNDRELGLLNGSNWNVTSCSDRGDMVADICVRSIDDAFDVVDCSTWLHHFFDREEELLDMKRRTHQEFTFGYAQTCHTAQGGQADDVLVFDESKQFSRDARKHLYTAITRSTKRLTIAVPT
jgi:Mesyanzhinovviridae Dda-like helicase